MKMRSSGRALIHRDKCPYKSGKLDTHRENESKTGDGMAEAKVCQKHTRSSERGISRFSFTPLRKGKKNPKPFWSTLVNLSVKHLTSGYDLTVPKSDPCIGLYAKQAKPTSDALSPSLSDPLYPLSKIK